ncbi:unnamed protein product, partial [Prorocentrum cordatum]
MRMAPRLSLNAETGRGSVVRLGLGVCTIFVALPWSLARGDREWWSSLRGSRDEIETLRAQLERLRLEGEASGGAAEHAE